MRIRRLSITLPSRFKATAQRDARLIAKRVAEQLGQNTEPRMSLEAQGQGAPGPALAQRLGAQIARQTRGRS